MGRNVFAAGILGHSSITDECVIVHVGRRNCLTQHIPPLLTQLDRRELENYVDEVPVSRRGTSVRSTCMTFC